MSYSATAAILSNGQATPSMIDAFIRSRGRALAEQYAPDRQYREPPPLGQPIIDACRRYADIGAAVNHDIVASQINLETAGWQSAIARDKRNPAGLGAEDDAAYAKAITFATPAEGIAAQVAHLLSYVLGFGPWSDADPRYKAVKAAGWLGSAQTLADLGGKWATSTTYGQSIATLANQLLATTGAPPVATVSKPPMNTDHPSPNKDGYGTPRHIEAVVWHISQGSLASNLSWLTNPASGASANYEIAKDGTIYELVPPEHSAWTNGGVKKPNMKNPLIAAWVKAGINPNTRTLSIEHEGMSSNNAGGSLTAEQVASHTWLTAWLCQEYSLPADRTHIIGHFEIDSVDRPYCPGFSGQEWDDYLNRVKGALVGGVVIPPAPADDALVVNGHKIVEGFKGLYEAVPEGARLVVYGLPEADEFETTPGSKLYDKHGVHSAQKFERAWMIWQPAQNPPVTVAARVMWPDLEAA